MEIYNVACTISAILMVVLALIAAFVAALGILCLIESIINKWCELRDTIRERKNKGE